MFFSLVFYTFVPLRDIMFGQVQGLGVRVLFPGGVQHVELVVSVRGAQVCHLPHTGEGTESDWGRRAFQDFEG